MFIAIFWYVSVSFQSRIACCWGGTLISTEFDIFKRVHCCTIFLKILQGTKMFSDRYNLIRYIKGPALKGTQSALKRVHHPTATTVFEHAYVGGTSPCSKLILQPPLEERARMLKA